MKEMVSSKMGSREFNLMICHMSLFLNVRYAKTHVQQLPHDDFTRADLLANKKYRYSLELINQNFLINNMF